MKRDSRENSCAITIFRLNAKHLDIQFEDGSRWDEAFQDLNRDS